MPSTARKCPAQPGNAQHSPEEHSTARKSTAQFRRAQGPGHPPNDSPGPPPSRPPAPPSAGVVGRSRCARRSTCPVPCPQSPTSAKLSVHRGLSWAGLVWIGLCPCRTGSIWDCADAGSGPYRTGRLRRIELDLVEILSVHVMGLSAGMGNALSSPLPRTRFRAHAGSWVRCGSRAVVAHRYENQCSSASTSPSSPTGPVVQLAALDARNVTMAATSLGSPKRRMM